MSNERLASIQKVMVSKADFNRLIYAARKGGYDTYADLAEGGAEEIMEPTQPKPTDDSPTGGVRPMKAVCHDRLKKLRYQLTKRMAKSAVNGKIADCVSLGAKIELIEELIEDKPVA